MKLRVFITAALLGIITLKGTAQDQKRFGIELNGGASFATQQIDDAKLKPGFGFEGVLSYRFMPHAGVYGGWGWNRMAAETSFAGSDVCFEETGYVLGLEFRHPLNATPLSYYVKAGGLYNHIEIENAEGAIINDSKHGMGYQLAAGVDLNIGSNWNLTAGVKFNSLNRETTFESANKSLTYQYISTRVGIAKRF